MTDKQPDALAKKLAKALEFDDFISVKLLRQAATLLRTQHKKIAAYELLTKSQEAQLSHHREQSDKYREAIATLQSEREANALLTTAIERKDALLRQAWRQMSKLSADDVCEALHHKKEDRHGLLAPCQVAGRFMAVREAITKALQ